jgi:threonine dehydrogenase-like Zn-dependent dehydrogenase
VQVNVGLLTFKELKYQGSFRYGVSSVQSEIGSVTLSFVIFQPGDYTAAISLVDQGKVDLKSLVTHRYGLFWVIRGQRMTFPDINSLMLSPL